MYVSPRIEVLRIVHGLDWKEECDFTGARATAVLPLILTNPFTPRLMRLPVVCLYSSLWLRFCFPKHRPEKDYFPSHNPTPAPPQDLLNQILITKKCIVDRASQFLVADSYTHHPT
ncbi:hypothetical protein ACLOJK_015290 [Asimina triloba]